MPNSFAAVPAFSAAICAAKGVLFLEPLNPDPPEVAQQIVLPCLSVIVTIVLLNEECICATPSLTTFLDFLPLTTVDYSGGVIISDWYSSGNDGGKESIKISIKLFSYPRSWTRHRFSAPAKLNQE